MMVELTGAGIWAIPYRNRRPHSPIRLPDGAILETPTPEQRREAPDGLIANLGLDAAGEAMSTMRADRSFGPKAPESFIGLAPGDVEPVFLLPDGRVAAVYGAVAKALDPA